MRSRRLANAKFRRQHPLEPYVLDFYCAEKKLVIEVDGSQHMESGAASDKVRSGYLKAEGIRVLRFDNLQVLRETDAVLT